MLAGFDRTIDTSWVEADLMLIRLSRDQLRDVARAVGMSERTGHLAFEAAGLCFTDELHRVRLDRARRRLLGGDSSVLQIAFAVGFSDGSHFHRLFKRRFGRSPGETRRGG